MTIPIFRSYVFLRYKHCNRKTDHVLTSGTNIKNVIIKETYECQECGENKVVYELTTITLLADHVDA